jgi:D-arabinose 5-phosphate isomerase GutQ
VTSNAQSTLAKAAEVVLAPSQQGSLLRTGLRRPLTVVMQLALGDCPRHRAARKQGFTARDFRSASRRAARRQAEIRGRLMHKGDRPPLTAGDCRWPKPSW